MNEKQKSGGILATRESLQTCTRGALINEAIRPGRFALVGGNFLQLTLAWFVGLVLV